MPVTRFQSGDSILIKNHTAGSFDPTNIGEHRTVSIKVNQVEIIQCHCRKTKVIHIKDVKLILPADIVISKITDYQQSSRKTKLQLIPDHVSYLE